MDALVRSVVCLTSERFLRHVWACDNVVEAIATVRTTEQYRAVLDAQLQKPLLVPLVWHRAKHLVGTRTPFTQVLKVRGLGGVGKAWHGMERAGGCWWVSSRCLCPTRTHTQHCVPGSQDIQREKVVVNGTLFSGERGE